MYRGTVIAWQETVAVFKTVVTMWPVTIGQKHWCKGLLDSQDLSCNEQQTQVSNWIWLSSESEFQTFTYADEVTVYFLPYSIVEHNFIHIQVIYRRYQMGQWDIEKVKSHAHTHARACVCVCVYIRYV